MSARDSLQNSEVAIIGRGVESVLRRLIRFLAGVISLAKLHELIDFIYVEEMDEKLRREHPRRQATLSTLALNTGLDTRVINRIRASSHYKRGLLNDAEFFRDFTPAASFLHLWSTDARFTDSQTGLPKPLTISGESGSLEELATSLKLPRGVTIKSVAEQLERSELVHLDREKGVVEMRVDRYLPSPDKDREGALEIGFVAVARLIDTVLGNLDPDLPAGERLYQRVYWINRLPPRQRHQFRERMAALLDEVEQESYRQLQSMDQPFDTPSQMSAGFGLYLFEDAVDNDA
ncbi:MAG: DUF6502 family protein [Gammaproteobacteria bacterium]